MHISVPKSLIFIPTYNELDNAPVLYKELRALFCDIDILFVDDNSPDGTGRALDELAKNDPRLFVLHRPGKQGIGTAHKAGIAWAYEHHYERLITMDCDFTHMPSDIPRMLEHATNFDAVVGSRYMLPDSLPGWNLLRRSLTNFGHLLTRYLLGIPQDATGAFRIYDLKKIPAYFFTQVVSSGYSFFFESMFLLVRNGYTIKEIPIALPARTYGHSKMSNIEAMRSGFRVLKLWVLLLVASDQFRISEPFQTIDPTLHDPQGWDQYWQNENNTSGFFYHLIARCYRSLVIKRQLTRVIRKNFPAGSTLLHQGCGSGIVDLNIQKEYRITAMDISVSALNLYKRNISNVEKLMHASVLNLPLPEQSFDGVYPLGVIEHFSQQEITQLFSQAHRVLKPGGKMVIFWVHRRATSVAVLRLIHGLLHCCSGKKNQFHPQEISRFYSRAHVESLALPVGLNVVDVSFGPRDFWVQAVVVLERIATR